MKIRNILIMFFLVCFIGCANGTTGSFYKPGVAFTKPVKIAVARFKAFSKPSSGQEASDLMAMAFFKKGYDIVEMNQILSLPEQEQIYDWGLTNDIKNKLKGFGVSAVIFGTVSEYRCSAKSAYIHIPGDDDQTCWVSFSGTMVDSSSGDVLWMLSRSDTMTGDKLEAGSVLRSMMRRLDTEIPDGTDDDMVKTPKGHESAY